MSGWDDGPVQVDEGEWVPPPMPVATGLTTNNISSGDNFFEDGADGGDRPRGTPGACRKCNEEGHFAAECPNQKCSCCGQKGHSASKCPTPKCNICNTEGHIPFECPQKDNQACRHCGETGHMFKECPVRANEPCRNCQQLGHRAAECTNQRKMQFGGADLEGEVEDKDQKIEACWNNMDQASKDRDLDAFKDAFFKYVALCPDSTFPTLQNAFKEEGKFAYGLVAIKKDITGTQVIVDLQGNMNKKFVVTFQTSVKGRRTKGAAKDPERFPVDDNDNMSRLENAGFVQESYVPWCYNCKETGHVSRACPQERQARDPSDIPSIKCVNCDQEGHRARDCPEERKQRRNPNACRNCGEEGHEAKECEKPRDASNVQCRKCEKMGHFSKDCPDAPKMTCRNCDQEGHRAAECPEPKKGMTCNNCGEEGHRRVDCTNPRKIICNNCDEEGHVGRDCPKPRDPARVKCRNCDEMGHSAKECPKPRDMSRIKCNECGEMGHWSRNCTNKGAGGDDDGFNATSGGGADYGSAPAVDTTQQLWKQDEPEVSSGGGGW
ncbi:hypothetical protein EYR41_004520 [Orbilia oligospora]|uniref:Uncharacterized protein n=1 Tax=Orbilia oligospora TaxID=2813651 RepID=A0A7C8PN59_ORBOL|nr:hypothetical protein TWF751_005351 [Orbilia oligospora]KAF3295083.1 hypothetical protein TWF132_002408 [Orbilia oligospora]TGJ72644.1 hypothetical protein EYR41_004520 [Orbilia oligospora]